MEQMVIYDEVDGLGPGVSHAGAVEVFVQLRSAPQPAYDATKVSAKVLAEQLGIVSEGDSRVAEIAPLLPATGRPGGQWADHRQVVNGILWKLVTGVP
jgi:hypothetical protein